MDILPGNSNTASPFPFQVNRAPGMLPSVPLPPGNVPGPSLSLPFEMGHRDSDRIKEFKSLLRPDGPISPGAVISDGVYSGVQTIRARRTEDGGSDDINPHKPFACYRDGRPLNEEAKELMEQGAVRAISVDNKGTVAVVGTGMRDVMNQKNRINEQTKPQEEKQLKTKRRKATSTSGVATQEPGRRIEISGTFGSTEVFCHRVIVEQTFIALVYDSSWKGPRWKPPLNLEDPEKFDLAVMTVSGSNKYEGYYFGVAFKDPEANSEYVIFHLMS